MLLSRMLNQQNLAQLRKVWLLASSIQDRLYKINTDYLQNTCALKIKL